MESILYIGNKLNNNKSNVAAITIIGALLEQEGYQVFYASSKINKLARLIDMLRACIVYRKKVDFVIIDTYSTLNFYFAFSVSQLCRLLGLKYITRLNGGNLPLRLKQNPKMSKSIFNHAYVSVSPSMYLKQKFNEFGYHNVKHIPNSLDIKSYPFSIKEYKAPRLLWVRSFSKIYNPKLAIKVFKSIKATYPNAELCMVGPDSDGTFSEVFELAKQLNLDVNFTGKLSKLEWITLSRDYNIFINTTNFDNTPVSILEAMALGLPIISTNVGGMPYLINNKTDGILVDSNNVEAMVKAIVYVLDNRNERNEMIKNARNKVEHYDWGIIKQLWSETLADNSVKLT